MATVRVDAKRFAAVFNAREKKRIDRVRGAMFESALLGAEVVAKAAPVDVGSLKSSIRAESTPKGAHILVDAPHAATLEIGSRPHTPPLQPILDWVRRHARNFGLKRPRIGVARTARQQTTKDAQARALEGVARGIQAKIARVGTKPRWYMRNALPSLRRILDRIVKRAVRDP